MSENTKPKKKDAPKNSSATSDKKTYNLDNISDQVEMFRDKLDDDTIKEIIYQHINQLIDRASLSEYRVVFLIDKHNSISGFHSDKIYKAIPDSTQNVLMIIESGGGEIEPAYLISKTCKRLSKEKFVVSIPRRAKSAATLISLGAKEIHMGLLSELGPIDPQFGGFPALGLSNAVEKIAAMTEKFPKSSDMFAKYLNEIPKHTRTWIL
jgi:ClpP class serine protease